MAWHGVAAAPRTLTATDVKWNFRQCARIVCTHFPFTRLGALDSRVETTGGPFPNLFKLRHGSQNIRLLELRMNYVRGDIDSPPDRPAV